MPSLSGMILFRSCCSDGLFAMRCARCLVEGANAASANKDALAIGANQLEVRMLAGPVYRVIVATKQAAFTTHLRAFVAH